MTEEKRSVERALDAIDGIRGLFGLALFAAIAMAAFLSGGPAGWLLGASLLLACVFAVVSHFRRSHQQTEPRSSVMTREGALAATGLTILSAISYAQSRYVSGSIFLTLSGAWFFARVSEARAHRRRH